jgi:putative Mn2+ efflux pump MntP
MDSFAISIANGIMMPKIKFSKALIIAFTIGIYHIVMTLVGYYLGHLMNLGIDQYDHWIAFILLSFIGLKMVYEALFSTDEMQQELQLNTWQINMQALATSIDAFAIGVSLSFLSIQILKASAIIGFICFFMVLVGLRAGKSIGSRISHYMELAGGIVLFLIGLKILIADLYIN